MTEPAHRVHGMAGNHVPAHWPPLTAEEVRAVLATYPVIGEVRAITWHSPRPLSAACLVQCAHAQVFIKRHHAHVRSVTMLEQEHRFSDHLRAAGMPIPPVLRDNRGRSACALQHWVYEVHARAEGIDLHRQTISWVPLVNVHHARSAGAMLGRLHHAADGYVAPQRTTHLLVARSELLCATDPLAALAAQLPQRPALARYLQARPWREQLAATLAPWHRHVQPRLARQPVLWTHGDWHVSNLCWSSAADNARVSAVLDFGLCAATFALFDLATAIERNAIDWLQLQSGTCRGHADIARALIAGYRHAYPLDADAIHLLADLLPLVHLDFALSEVEYFASFIGEQQADVAFDTFLRGHAAWFANADGTAMLEAIRACA
ncbi:MAG: phosphotransferase [Rhodanobacter sp.]